MLERKNIPAQGNDQENYLPEGWVVEKNRPIGRLAVSNHRLATPKRPLKTTEVFG